MEDQRAFAEKVGVPFPLVADAGGELIARYGAASPKGYARRITFVIGPDGKIFKVFNEVNVETHDDDVLVAVKASLGVD